MDRARRHQHRTLQPQGTQQPPNSARLADSLDSIRQEFDAISQDANLIRSQRDELETSGHSNTFPLSIL